MKKDKLLFGIIRLGMGWVFLWSFLDKMFGWGFATPADQAWIAGGSPTTGFLTYGTKGPFADIFQSLAGNPIVDWLFMLGLLGIGVALILGIGVKVAGYAGVLMFALMYLAGFIPPEHNPFFDEHVLNALILLMLVYVDAGMYLGLGKKWQKQTLVKKYPWLA
ncbi:hypothetical protein KJ611_01795 [Patescibacteria group bacterium]|nr:hypothetical protein [Patescibacteria group bacterium]MBU1705124.1 hypothetical protein [Patescibacteria group bacterium]